MRISDWISDVCSSDLHFLIIRYGDMFDEITASSLVKMDLDGNVVGDPGNYNRAGFTIHSGCYMARPDANCVVHLHTRASIAIAALKCGLLPRSEEHTSELQSLMPISYAVFCLKQKHTNSIITKRTHQVVTTSPDYT